MSNRLTRLLALATGYGPSPDPAQRKFRALVDRWNDEPGVPQHLSTKMRLAFAAGSVMRDTLAAADKQPDTLTAQEFDVWLWMFAPAAHALARKAGVRFDFELMSFAVIHAMQPRRLSPAQKWILNHWVDRWLHVAPGPRHYERIELNCTRVVRYFERREPMVLQLLSDTLGKEIRRVQAASVEAPAMEALPELA